MSNQHDWAVAVIGVMPDETHLPMVRDPMKPRPHFWKLPGGKKDPADADPEQTARREFLEETGLTIGRLCLVKEEARPRHTIYFFMGRAMSGTLLQVGNEGEDVALFDQRELPHMVDLFQPHRVVLEELGIIPTPQTA